MNNMTTNWFKNLVNDKLPFSALATMIFIGISVPVTYMTEEMVSAMGLSNLINGGGEEYMEWTYNRDTGEEVEVPRITDGCLMSSGKYVQLGVFFVVLFFMMKWLDDSNLSNGIIAKRTVYVSLLFYLLSSSDAYSLTSNGYTVCPSRNGILMHSIAFLVLLTLFMYLPKDEQ